MYSNKVAPHFLYDFELLSRSGKPELGNWDNGSIQGLPWTHFIGMIHHSAGGEG